jgi:hypothetical protein
MKPVDVEMAPREAEGPDVVRIEPPDFLEECIRVIMAGLLGLPEEPEQEGD